MTTTTSKYDKLGIKWFPIKLEITKNPDGTVKNKKPVFTWNYMPKQTDFKDLTDTQIKVRHKHLDTYKHLAVDTSKYYQLDIDMKDSKTYSPEQWKFIKDFIKDKPYYKSISVNNGKKEGKHILFTCDYKFEKKRVATIFEDIEILCGQWAWQHKNSELIIPDNYMCHVENIETILKKKENKEKKKKKRKMTITFTSETDAIIVSCANMIDINYIDNRDSWIQIVASLKSEGNHYQNLAKSISQKSSKYEDDAFDRLWLENLDEITIGSLYHFAKLSNEQEYLTLMKSRFNYLDKCSTTEADIADIFIHHNKSDLVFKNLELFIYHNNTWIKQDKDLTHLQAIITKKLLDIYIKYRGDLNIEYRDELSKGDQCDNKICDDLDIKMEIFNKVITKIKTTSGTKSIARQIYNTLSLQDFEHIEFDSKLDIVPFKTKIYDLNTHEFRNYKNTDYITMKINYDYEKPTSEVSNQFTELFNQIFPDDNIKRDYSIILSSVLFARGGSADVFIVSNGNGGNGKGVLHELMSELLTSVYAYKAPISVICNPITQGSNPEVAGMHNKRFVVYSEPSKNDTIDIGSMKQLVGGDRINARMNYSNNTETLLKGLHFLEANEKPKLNGKMDDSISRRLIDIHFMSTFTGNKDLLNEEYHYPANDYFRTSEFKKVFKFALFQYLIEFIKEYQSKNKKHIYEGIVNQMSQTTRNRTEKYIENSDILGSFLRDNIEKTGDDNDILSIKEIHQLFKSSEEYQDINKADKSIYNGVKKFNKLVSCHTLYRKLFKEKHSFKRDGTPTTARNILLGCRIIEEDDEEEI